MPATCSLLTRLVDVFKPSMSHCFNVIWTCQPARHSMVMCLTKLPSNPSLPNISWEFAQLVLLARWDGATMRWQDEPRLWQEDVKSLEVHIGEKLLTDIYIEKIVRGQIVLNWGDGGGLGGEWDRFRDIKEGSGFPCASALFLGDWNVLQEQHELPRAVMALPPGTLQACLTRS